jgi:hypothetical protein
VSFLLTGCLQGSKDLFPHDDRNLVKLLKPGVYTKKSDTSSEVFDLAIADNGEYTAISGESIYRIGFYDNKNSTYVMYVKKDDDVFYYFLAEKEGENKLIIYNVSKASAELLNIIAGKTLETKIYYLPFTVKSYNKSFLERLAGNYKKHFVIDYVVGLNK